MNLSHILVVSGTGTEIGKTATVASIAALAAAGGWRVAVLKPAQTGTKPGEPGDVDQVRSLVGSVTTIELARYPDPLAPEAAARLSGLPPVTPIQAADAARQLAASHDLVLIEGAGGLLVRFDPAGGTLADVAAQLPAPVLLVTTAGLGTLNATALSAEALRHRDIRCAGMVIGSWPRQPGLAERSNLIDLPVAAGAPLLGVLPEGIATLAGNEFTKAARGALAAALGGSFDANAFTAEHVAGMGNEDRARGRNNPGRVSRGE